MTNHSSIYNEITKLSKREREVLSLISDGFQNKAIAKKLFISVKTIEFHKENIKHKLGILNTKEIYNLNLDTQCYRSTLRPFNGCRKDRK